MPPSMELALDANRIITRVITGFVAFLVVIGSRQTVALAGSGSAVTVAATTTSLTVTRNGSNSTTVASGGLVTLIASVTAGGTAVTPGVVNFCDANVDSCNGPRILGTARLTSTGTAVLRTFPAVGSHSYKAVFVGTTSYAASASTAQELNVTGTSQTSVTSSGAAGNYTLTASVAAAGATIAPTGTVYFEDLGNNFSLGSGTLGSGKVALNLAYNSALPSLGTWSPYFTVVGDFNGDGKQDLAVVQADGGPLSPAPPNAVVILLGNGDGTFTPGPATPLTNMLASYGGGNPIAATAIK